MVNIKEIAPEIVEALKPLEPDKIILFGSYAYGKPSEDSDIDLFLLKDSLKEEMFRLYSQQARLKLLKLLRKYGVGFDVISRNSHFLKKRDDYFFKYDILKKGILLYAK